MLPLLLVTDDSGRDWHKAASRLPRGSIVLVRAREAAMRAVLFDLLRPLAHLRLLIANDPVLAMEADGLHLPECRLAEAARWRVRRPHWIITAAAHSARAALKAQALDAVLLSSVFATTSHPDKPPLTPLRAGAIAAAFPVPVYALGGVTAQNAALLPPIFSGIAAISALCAG